MHKNCKAVSKRIGDRIFRQANQYDNPGKKSVQYFDWLQRNI